MYISAVTCFVYDGDHCDRCARARLDAARIGHDPVYLTKRGRRVAAVIDANDLDRLIAAAEDLADIETAQAARNELASGETAIPWEQVKSDLGLA